MDNKYNLVSIAENCCSRLTHLEDLHLIGEYSVSLYASTDDYSSLEIKVNPYTLPAHEEDRFSLLIDKEHPYENKVYSDFQEKIDNIINREREANRKKEIYLLKFKEAFG